MVPSFLSQSRCLGHTEWGPVLIRASVWISPRGTNEFCPPSWQKPLRCSDFVWRLAMLEFVSGRPGSHIFLLIRTLFAHFICWHFVNKLQDEMGECYVVCSLDSALRVQRAMASLSALLSISSGGLLLLPSFINYYFFISLSCSFFLFLFDFFFFFLSLTLFSYKL